MSSKRSKSVERVEPPTADDFKLIRGIGSHVEQRLHGAGILTYARLAALSPADIMALTIDLGGITSEQISRQDWIGQANELVGNPGSFTPKPEFQPVDEADYATFRVKLLLDADNNVQETSVLHLESNQEAHWKDWQDPILMAEFFAKSAGLRLPIKPPALAMPVEAPTLAAPKVSTQAKPTQGGRVRLQGLELVTGEEEHSRNLLPFGQPFKLKFGLDLTGLTDRRDTKQDYTVRVYARSLEGQPRQLLGEIHGNVIPQEQEHVNLELEGVELVRGVYRIEATVAMTAAQPEARAMLEGGRIQIY